MRPVTSRTTRWAMALLLSGGVGLAARRRDALSSSGAVGACAVGTAICGAGGLRDSLLLLLFFGSSTALSRLDHPVATRERGDGEQTPGSHRRDKHRLERGPRRTLAQVLANGGVPAALALCGVRTRSRSLSAAYAGALAAANADTWATELGRLSRTAPRMITTGQPALPGVSGAVTPLGTLASLAGATVIGAAWAGLHRPSHAWPARRDGRHLAALLMDTLRIGAAGFAGALADSLLGATLQGVYSCRVCGARTEDRTHRHGDAPPALIHTRGLPVMTNDAVNLCATLTGAALGAVLAGPAPAKPGATW